MLFADFRSAFNTISSMKLVGKLKTLGLNTTTLSLPGLCAQPPPVHTGHPWLHSQTWKRLSREVVGRRLHHQLHYKEWWEFISGGNQQSCRVRTIYCSSQQNQGADCLFWKTKRERDPPVYIHGVEVEQVNSFKLPRNHHHREPVKVNADNTSEVFTGPCNRRVASNEDRRSVSVSSLPFYPKTIIRSTLLPRSNSQQQHDVTGI